MSDKNFHLQMIQGTVNRLAHNSFLLKGWSVALIAALFTLAELEENGYVILLAYFPVIIFWGLDAYFLREERLFRKLFDNVRKKEDSDIDFSMNHKDFENEVENFPETLFSKTLRWFHGAILGTLIVVTIFAIIGDYHGT